MQSSLPTLIKKYSRRSQYIDTTLPLHSLLQSSNTLMQRARPCELTLAGGTRPAAVICPAKKRLNRDAASMTALHITGSC